MTEKFTERMANNSKDLIDFFDKRRKVNIQLLVNLTTVICFTGGHPICYMKKKICI